METNKVLNSRPKLELVVVHRNLPVLHSFEHPFHFHCIRLLRVEYHVEYRNKSYYQLEPRKLLLLIDGHQKSNRIGLSGSAVTSQYRRTCVECAVSVAIATSADS